MDVKNTKALFLLGILLLATLVFPRAAKAEEQRVDSLDIGNGSISITGVGQAVQAGKNYTFSNEAGLRLTGSSEVNGVTLRYGVGSEEPIRLRFDHLQIDTSGADLCAFSVLENAQTVIELMEGTANRLVSADYYAGLQAQNLGGKSGKVRLLGGGSLYAQGGRGSAGIGGAQNVTHWYGTGGSITIESGTITAIGGEEGAGIGGGYKGDGGVINISGGTISAQGGAGAAGIGGGHYGLAGSLSITAEDVEAVAGEGGEAIGTGANSDEKHAGETEIAVNHSSDVSVQAVPTAEKAPETSPPEVEAVAQEETEKPAGKMTVAIGLFLVLVVLAALGFGIFWAVRKRRKID